MCVPSDHSVHFFTNVVLDIIFRARVTCDVDADPPEVTFHWHLNHSMETAIPHSMQGATRSVATFIARSEADYGALSCEARNSVGPQRRPCLFSVVPAGPPEPPGLCALANQTEEAFQVRCIEGHHGGLPQHFVLEIHDSGGRFRGNVTSPMPYFEASLKPPVTRKVSDLPSGSEFVLVVYAANGKGRSPPVLLTAATLPAAAESLLHQGPDASWQIKFSPVLAVLMALVLGFALLAFVVVAAVRLWSRHSFHKDANGSKMPSPEERPWIPPAPDVVDRIQVSPKNETTEMDTFVSAKGLCMATLDQDQSVINTFMQRAPLTHLYSRGARDRLHSSCGSTPSSPGNVHTASFRRGNVSTIVVLFLVYETACDCAHEDVRKMDETKTALRKRRRGLTRVV
ncbi:hypothetical protein HPB49_022865 [Dermacentor silvarum]|uniref:Uncharacterized protein n=1 Tax=Dermacentor silvarum TaxID=543639 RepID=A0ACB8CN29_DERSI|nr:hypothetical protein HPB49_022865 [Dermacentor silvarum]